MTEISEFMGTLDKAAVLARRASMRLTAADTAMDEAVTPADNAVQTATEAAIADLEDALRIAQAWLAPGVVVDDPRGGCPASPDELFEKAAYAARISRRILEAP